MSPKDGSSFTSGPFARFDGQLLGYSCPFESESPRIPRTRLAGASLKTIPKISFHNGLDPESVSQRVLD